MTITLFRCIDDEFYDKDAPLRTIEVRDSFNKKEVIEGIQTVIGNHSGPLILRFQARAFGRSVSVTISFDTTIEGWSTKGYANVVGDTIVEALKKKGQQILERA